MLPNFKNLAPPPISGMEKARHLKSGMLWIVVSTSQRKVN